MTQSKKKKRKNMKNEQEKDIPTQEKETKAEATEASPLDDQVDDHSAKSMVAQGADVQQILAAVETDKKTSTDGLKNSYDKLEVRSSPIEGFGVFATANINKGEILEEIPFILWPRYTLLGGKIYQALRGAPDNGADWICDREKHNEDILTMFGFKTPEKYYFKWHPPHQDVHFSVIPLGFGPIYNSSNTDNNAGWQAKTKTFVFVSTRDIKKGEEICTFYGYFLSEDGSIFGVTDVLGMGIDKSSEDGHTYLRCVRFIGPEDIQMKTNDAGYQKINSLLGQAKSNGAEGLKVRRINIVENGEDKHVFDFPEKWTVHNTYLKLKEFKFSRFKNIKLLLTYEEESEKEANDKKRKNNEQIVEVGEEIVITNFNGV